MNIKSYLRILTVALDVRLGIISVTVRCVNRSIYEDYGGVRE